jgi:restriction endonuclease S subunit
MTELPNGWEWSTVEDIAGLTDGPFGSNLKTSHYTEAGPRVVRLQNIGHGVFRDDRAHISASHFAQLEKHSVVPGDVVVASLGLDAPRACMVPSDLGDAIVKADCIRVRTMEGVHPAYLMWMLNSPPMRKQGASIIKGVGRPRLGLTGLRRLHVPVPPLNEQQRIVAAIEEQFSRLDVAETLLAEGSRRAALFRESVLAQAFAESPRTRKIGEVAVLSDGPFGSNLKTSDYVEDGPRVIRLQNIGDGIFRDEHAHITEEHFARLAKHAVFPRDIVAASLGEHAPRACLVPVGLGPAIVKADCIRIRPTSDVDPSYLMWALNSRPVRMQAGARIKGIGRPRLGLGGMRDLVVPIPSLDEQVRIVAQIERSLSLMNALKQAVETAKSRSLGLRRSILDRAFRGDLVPRDQSDESAAGLLERVRAQREAAPSRRRTP